MNPLDLLNATERHRFRELVLLSVASGILNGVVMSLVGTGFSLGLAGQDPWRVALGFVAVLGLALLCGRYQRQAAATLVFDFLCRVRIRVADEVARLELREFELFDGSRISSGLAADARLLSESAVALTGFLILLSDVAFVLVFLFWLSPVVFWLAVAVGLAGLVLLSVSHLRLHRAEAALGQAGHELDLAAEELIDGFKELRLNERRRKAFLTEALVPAVRGSRAARIVMGRWAATNAVAMEGLILLLGATVVLALPLLSADHGATALKASLLVLSLPAAYALELPVVFRAWSALGRIQALLRELAERGGDAAPASPAGPVASPPPVLRSGLAFDQVYFRYVDDHGRPGFGVGPLSIEFVPGHLHFLVGGNGSGKSTVLKLAMGLYRPVAGQILVDDEPADEAARRRLIAAVFADSHVFDRLYGYREADPGRVNDLLDHLGIANKTRFENGRFTNLDLSTGQKKRVAMVSALIEDKPVYVFDEWAADQDPEFRDRFYRQLLPELTARGKTVIAATHDDRYFDLADHLFQFDKGWLVDTWHHTDLPKPSGERGGPGKLDRGTGGFSS